MATELRFDEILRVLTRHRVEFVVVGGIAALPRLTSHRLQEWPTLEGWTIINGLGGISNPNLRVVMHGYDFSNYTRSATCTASLPSPTSFSTSL